MLSNEKGYALPLVIIVIAVLVLLSTALWHFGIAETLQVSRDEKRAKAHYLARSGLSVTEKTLEERTQELLVDNNESFSLHGPLDNDSMLEEWELEYNVNSSGSEPIFIEVAWDGLEAGVGSGTIIARGRYLGVEEIIERDFIYLYLLDGESLGWYKTQGQSGAMIMPGGSIGEENLDYDGHVLLTNDGEGILAQHNAPTALSATAMHFIDERDSLIIKANADRLELITNQIYFDGNVVFEGAYENIILNIRDEAEVFKGQDLKDSKEYLESIEGNLIIEFDNYGLLYLGAQGDEGVDYDSSILTGNRAGNRNHIHESLVPGFYFFPDMPEEGGLKLGSKEDLAKLLRITDIDKFDLEILRPGLVFRWHK